jgi:hypothetical protein
MGLGEMTLRRCDRFFNADLSASKKRFDVLPLRGPPSPAFQPTVSHNSRNNGLFRYIKLTQSESKPASCLVNESHPILKNTDNNENTTLN